MLKIKEQQNDGIKRNKVKRFIQEYDSLSDPSTKTTTVAGRPHQLFMIR